MNHEIDKSLLLKHIHKSDLLGREKLHLENMLEKQNPKMIYYEADTIYDIAFCPICGREFEFETDEWGCKYCCDCGQALDWSDNNENS